MIKYNVRVYNIPFMKDGEEVFLPVAGSADPYGDILGDGALNDYIIFNSYADDMEFIASQSQIIISGSEDDALNNRILSSNYIAITRVKNGEEVKSSTLFYWVDAVERLDTADGYKDASFVFRISKDYFMSSLAPNQNGVTVQGRILQTTQSTGENGDARIPIQPDYTGMTISRQEGWDLGDISAVAACVTPQGSFNMIEIPISMIENIEEFQGLSHRVLAAAVLQMASTIVSYLPATNSPLGRVNVNISRVFAIPRRWLEFFNRSAIASVTFKAAGTSELSLSGAYFITEKNATDAENYYGYDMVDTLTAFRSYDITDGTKIYIRTPSRTVELSGNMAIQTNRTVDIYMTVSRGGSDLPKIFMVAGGTMIDISEDFTIDFAINEAALWEAQHKTASIMKYISTAMSAAGGVAGGLASQNYFGAVQSAVAGVTGISSMIAERTEPASVTSGGSAANGLIQIGLLGAIEIRAKNELYIQSMIAQYGYILNSTPREVVNFSSINMRAFYKMDGVQVYGLQNGGQDAANYIAVRMMQGVRFIRNG